MGVNLRWEPTTVFIHKAWVHDSLLASPPIDCNTVQFDTVPYDATDASKQKETFAFVHFHLK